MKQFSIMPIIGGALLLVMTCGGGPASAARIHLFDIDGSVFHDSGLSDEGKQPAFWSYWKLVRSKHVGGGLALVAYEAFKKSGMLPKHVLLNRHEYDLYRKSLAKAKDINGPIGSAKLMRDPLGKKPISKYEGKRPPEFIPGFYYVSDDETFQFHDSGEEFEEESINPMLIDLKNAVRRTAAAPEKYEWRGRAFKFLRRELNRQSNLDRVYFLTDRNYSREAMGEVLMELFKLKEIPYPGVNFEGEIKFPKVLSMSHVSGRLLSRMNEFGHRKAIQIGEKAAELVRSPLAMHETISTNPNEAVQGIRIPMHEVIFYENDPDYIRDVSRELRAKAAEYPSVKFVLYHSGPVEHVKNAEFNHGMGDKWSRWVIFTAAGKGWRSPTNEELMELEADLEKSAWNSKPCRILLPEVAK